MTSEQKRALYQQSAEKILALVDGETDTLLKMSSMVAVLKQSFPQFYWIGFYRAVNGSDSMIIGPYQGTPACLHIPFGKGVCGKAASDRETQVIQDVHAFPGHIACDAASLSEIVIPIINKNAELIAVLDIDSTELSSFDQTDRKMLEPLCNQLFSHGNFI